MPPADTAEGGPPVIAVRLENNRPLHERVPLRDEHGSLLGDFMVLLPGLRELPSREFQERIRCLQVVLQKFPEVVFADLNLPLNLLWVSVRPRPGVILELFGVMQWHVPEARLVGHRQS